MKYQKLGNSGLEVSRVCLGTMSFGSLEHSAGWALEEKDSIPIIDKAIEAGINFIDTANIYSNGISEEIVGKAVRELRIREDLVIATKFYCKMHDAPNGGGASRKSIMREVDASLRRLNTDYIDLYILHRWDDGTPIEETMETLDDLVHSGKVRYIGASAMRTWQFQKAMNVAEKNGWVKFISMQNHYNLINREEEREMIPYCIDAGVGITPYKPLAAGRLARPKEDVTRRMELDKNAVRKYYGNSVEADGVIIDRIGRVAEKNGISRAEVSLSWLLSKKPINSVICGVTKITHLTSLLNSVDIKLSAEDIRYLEEMYSAHNLTEEAFS